MAPLCTSNQPPSVYPHIRPLIHLCLCIYPPLYSIPLVLTEGPFVGAADRCLFINLRVVRETEEEVGASLS